MIRVDKRLLDESGRCKECQHSVRHVNEKGRCIEFVAHYKKQKRLCGCMALALVKT